MLVLDLQLPIAPVELQVGGNVADVVLAAQFLGDLVERFTQLVELVADIDDAATSLLRQLVHVSFAGVPEAAVKSPVSAKQDVDDGVGFLRRLNGILDFESTAFILPVR